VSKNATQEEIKKAYIKLMKNKNSGNAEKVLN
jgi:DnaJ-class molecular chaperone